jgi:hypothetical protein
MRMGTPTPEAPRPNRRRAIVVCSAFAVILSGVIYYLWTNHAYLSHLPPAEPGA